MAQQLDPTKISQWEVERYWEIFATLAAGSKHLSGAQAATVLKNSNLRDAQLERIWDLADVDNDGQLDFEEFCVAMRLIYDVYNGVYADVPSSLPDWLVPESKAHLVQAGRALNTGHNRATELDDDDDDDTRRLQDGFDWYISPAQRREYEDIYTSARDAHGYVAFSALTELYASLDVPDTDVRSAWNLVNPAADEVIGKDAALAFLHVLRGRHDGFRIPRTVPPSLRASFERRDISYNVDRVRTAAARAADDSAGSTKQKFGNAYLSRLGTAARPKGTTFEGKTTEDWEEVRLKKQLRELEASIERTESAARERDVRAGGSGMRDSRPALVKRELEQMLEYKRRELREVQEGSGTGVEAGRRLKSVEEEIKAVKEQVEGLEAHLRRREEVLTGLRSAVAEERARR